jgi:hypothetical protein
MDKIYYLYSYTISKLKPTNRVRLIYVLKGRGKEQGLIKRLKGKFIASACFIIPPQHKDEVEEVFEYWKAPFKRINIIILPEK